MRTLISCALAASVLLGCASSPKPAAAPVAAPASKEVKIDSTNIAAAQAAGYKVVDENGKTLFCKKELQTGSHVRYRTSCLTEQEWVQLSEASRAGVQDMARRQAPPVVK